MSLNNQLFTDNNNPNESIPGSFNENIAASSGNDEISSTEEVSSHTDISDNYYTVILRYLSVLLTIPMLFVYLILRVLFLLIPLAKPLKLLNGYYKKHHQKTSNYEDNLGILLSDLNNRATQSGNRDELDNEITNNYTFGSLYQSTDCILQQHIFKGTYPELLKVCSDKCKFAIIYLHSPLLDDTETYINHVLCSEVFVNSIKKYQCHVWFCDVTTSEGLQVVNSLKISRFPYLGVFSLNISFEIVSIYKVEGNLSTWNSSTFSSTLSKEYPKILQLRQKKQNFELQRIIRLQQDSRYQTSLLRDQERDRQIQQERQIQLSEETERNNKKQWLRWKQATLHNEPSDSSEICRVAIRFEDGTRVTRKFNKNLQVLEIYDFVELTLNDMSVHSNEGSDVVTPPSNYNHRYSFSLSTLVPKRHLNPTTVISQDDGIYPSGNIMVESLIQ